MNKKLIHYLICVHCHHIIESETLDMHVLMDSRQCTNGFRRKSHFYVSMEWLLHRRANPGTVGWRMKEPILSQSITKLVPKAAK
jgi:hypothetical protein